MPDENQDEDAFKDPTEDQTPEGETPEKKEEEDDKSKRSEIAQKIKYREKYQSELTKREKLEAELTQLRGAVKPPTDEAEAKAQEYIRKQARDVYEELQGLKQKEESARAEKLRSAVDEIIDENPDISEAELLEAIEEYGVEPKVALKILKKQENRTKKPKMPVARHTSSEGPKEQPDDSKKSIWDITKEEIAKLHSS